MSTVLFGNNTIQEVKYLKSFSDHEDTHPIVKVAGIDTWLRARSEILIIGDGKLYISKKRKGLCSEASDSGFIYDVPGGGWQEDEDPYVTARREAEEEAHITTQLVQACGSYAVIRIKAHPWVQEHVPEEYIWKGYYTRIFVGEFAEVYTGKVDPRDEDPEIADGEWVDLSEIMELLSPAHQKALKAYISWRKGEMK